MLSRIKRELRKLECLMNYGVVGLERESQIWVQVRGVEKS